MKFTLNHTGQLINYKTYAAFGETTLDTLGVTRQGYIGKEKDIENSLGDHGVRKYDYETGRFNSIDPLWEKYYGWSPYQYAGNNPIWAKDWNGKAIDIIADAGFIAYDLWDIGSTIAKGEKVTATQMGALGADILGAAIPFATGGGLAVRAAAKADDVVDAAKVVSKKSNDFLEAINTVSKYDDQTKAALKNASELQMLEKGTPIAGAGAKRNSPIKDINRLINQYGGNIADWSKKTSSAYKKDGVNIQTHWYENIQTGNKVEFKTNIEPIKKGK